MPKMKKLITVGILLLSAWSSSVFAHGYGGWRRHGFGRYWVAPAIVAGVLTYDVLQPRVVQASPPVVIVPSAPQVAPQSPSPSAAPSAPVWYYCQSTESYYPSVQTCDEQWKVIPAAPPPAR